MTHIAIDIGGSGSRITTSDAAALRITGPAPVLGSRGYELATVVHALADALGPVDESVEVAAVSAAGIVSRGSNDDVVAVVRERWRPSRVVVVSDAVAAVVAAWGMGGGATVAAGTGVVAFGTDLEREWRRSDGWGHLVGDEGGAAWLGREGLTAALRARDGRTQGSQELLARASARFGDLAGLPALLRSARNPAAQLASFAPDVTDSARGGDHVGTRIVRQAASHLAEAGLSVLSPSVPARLALVGGLSKDATLRDEFVAEVRAARPSVEVIQSDAEPIDGALALAGIHRSSYPPYLTYYN